MDNSSSIRKCVFTGRKANSKLKIFSKEIADDELHNWAIEVPCCSRYIEQREVGEQDPPTEWELQVAEMFYQKELARLRVHFYDIKLKQLQKTGQPLKDNAVVERDLNIMRAEQDIINNFDDKMDGLLRDKLLKLKEK